MTWFSKTRFVQFAVLALAAGEISSASAQALILRALGPSASNYRVGTRVPNNTAFRLRAGDSIVVLTGGRTRTFRGPGVFRPDGPSSAAQVAEGRTRYISQTGAVRGAATDEPQRPSDVWHYDVTQNGRACVRAGARPVLWRPVNNGAVQLTITPQSGAPQTLAWAAGQNTLNWPAALPVVNGGSYQLSWSGAAPVRITTAVIPPASGADTEALASALLENRCTHQLQTLIEANADPRDSAEGTATAQPARPTRR